MNTSLKRGIFLHDPLNVHTFFKAQKIVMFLFLTLSSTTTTLCSCYLYLLNYYLSKSEGNLHRPVHRSLHLTAAANIHIHRKRSNNTESAFFTQKKSQHRKNTKYTLWSSRSNCFLLGRSNCLEKGGKRRKV